VHVVGFIIRIYHDARSPERQILFVLRHKPETLHTVALAVTDGRSK